MRHTTDDGITIPRESAPRLMPRLPKSPLETESCTHPGYGCMRVWAIVCLEYMNIQDICVERDLQKCSTNVKYKSHHYGLFTSPPSRSCRLGVPQYSVLLKTINFSERDSSFTQNLPFVCCFYSTTQTLLIIKNLKKAGVNLKHQTHLSHKRCIFMQSICVSP